MQSDIKFMQLAINQAIQAQTLGEVPIGAILVYRDKVIAQGHNQCITDHDASGHAEIIVLRRAGQILTNYRLPNSTLYVTLEPCAMCFGAMVHARIRRLVFAASDSKTGVCGGCSNLVSKSYFNHRIELTSGIMTTEYLTLLSKFFQDKR